MIYQCLRLLFLLTLCAFTCAAGATFSVESLDKTTRVIIAANNGSLLSISSSNNNNNSTLPLHSGAYSIAGCTASAGAVQVQQLSNGSVTVDRPLTCTSSATFDGKERQYQIVLHEMLSPSSISIRWSARISVAALSEPLEKYLSSPAFTLPIEVTLAPSDASGVHYSTTWGRGCVANDKGKISGLCASNGPWRSPLTDAALPATADVYRLGAPSLKSMPPSTDGIVVPAVALLPRDSSDAATVGVTLMLDLDEPMQEVLLLASAEEGVTFSRQLLRMAPGTSNLTVTAHLVAHAADWRASLNRTLALYPLYFQPNSSTASDYEGLASYSWNKGVFNATRAKQLGYRTNWDLSGVWMPYDGLYLPYMDQWTNLGPINPGLAQYNVTPADIAHAYNLARNAGFHTLSYFDVGNWGVNISISADGAASDLTLSPSCGTLPSSEPAPCPTQEGSQVYLQRSLMPALLREAWSVVRGDVLKPISDWVGCVVMDPGDGLFAQLLSFQISQHFIALGESFEGIAIDRLDYTEYYNTEYDDGLSWVPLPGTGESKYGAARSLRVSHRAIFDRVGRLLHVTDPANPRLMWLNCNSVCRIDFFASADGTFSEGSALNMVAWAGLAAPSVLWTYELAGSTDVQLDVYFQQHLLMDTFPMAPMPKNDHSQLPGNATVEAAYMTYGPLFTQLAGSRWLLVPQPVQVQASGTLEVNAFVRERQGDILVVLALASPPTQTVTVRLASAEAHAMLKASPRRVGATAINAEGLVPGVGEVWKPLKVDDEGYATALLSKGMVMVRFYR